MNEVRICTQCGTTVEREHRSSTDGRAVTTYHVFGAQSQSSGLLETQHAHWVAGTCPSCGATYETKAPVKKAQSKEPSDKTLKKEAPSSRTIVWFVLKMFVSLLMLSCCITDVQGTAWVRGATGESSPFFFTLAGYTVLFYWAYCVIWIPIKPASGEKR